MMRTKLAVSLLAATLVAGVSFEAQGQRRRGLVDITARSERHGFWINLGVGAGKDRYKFADESSYPGWDEAITKPAFSLRLGGTVSPHFRLGGEITGWADSHYDVDNDRVTEYIVGALLIGQLYPARNLGLFVKGGAGFSRSGVDVVGPFDTHEDGFAWSLGAGYEIKLSRSLFLTPTVDFLQHRSEQRDAAGVALPALQEQLLTVGVALTIQPGR